MGCSQGLLPTFARSPESCLTGRRVQVLRTVFSWLVCAVPLSLMTSSHAGLLALPLTGEVHSSFAFLWHLPFLLPDMGSDLCMVSSSISDVTSSESSSLIPTPLHCLALLNFFLKLSSLTVYFTMCSLCLPQNTSCIRLGILLFCLLL